jgi:hypothetical protein
MDESGISTVPNKLPKVTAEIGKIIVDKIVSADRGQLVTVVCCFSASGVLCSSNYDISRKRMCNELYSEVRIGTLSLISDTGYMKKYLFVQWLHHFQNNAKATETAQCYSFWTTKFLIAAWRQSFSAERTTQLC